MAGGKIEKIIEFQAQKAVGQLNQVISRLNRTNQELQKMEEQAQAIDFSRFIPAINQFAKSFANLKIDEKNISDIQVMAQALNRYRMVAVETNKDTSKFNFSKITQGIYGFTNSMARMDISDEITGKISSLAQSLNRFKMVSLELNKSDFNVSFEKITRGIYSFMGSMNRMEFLNGVVEKVSALGQALNRLVNVSMKLQNIKVSFTSLTQAIYAFVGSILRIKDLESVTTTLERLGNAMEKIQLNSSRFSLIKALNNLEKMESTTEELRQKLKLLENNGKGVFGNLKNWIEKAANTIKNLPNYVSSINNGMSELKRLLSLTWLRSIYNMFKRIGEAIYDLVKVYSEYIENINLATVAYNGLEEATEELYPFVEKLSYAFGLNESEVIRAVGLFKQMANAMGLAEEEGTLLSEGLTKMAYDISSLYNISFDRALSSLQSALVGQTKPIRGATGADITENTLRITLQELNIGKEIRDLSYVEKRLIMVISLTQQLAKAQGDLAYTIESPSNQLKILSQQLERLKIALGELLEIGTNYILPMLNGAVMALVVIVETFTTLIKQLVGYEEELYDYDRQSGTSDELSELIEGMEEANEVAEELKKNLIGIDELNILEPQSTSSNDVIDPTILAAFEAALKDWDNMMDDVNMKAYAIRDAILSWFGLTPQDDGSWGLKEGENLARNIYEFLSEVDFGKLISDLGQIVTLITLGSIAWLTWKVVMNPFMWIIAGIYEIWRAWNTELSETHTWLDSYEQMLLGISLVVAGIAILFKSWGVGALAIALFGVYEIVKGINDIVSDGITNWQDVQKILIGISLILGAFAIVTKNWIVAAIAGVFLLSAVAINQLVGFEERFKNGTTTLGDWVAIVFLGVLTGIVAVIETILKALLTGLLGVVYGVVGGILVVATTIVATIETLLAPLIAVIKSVLSVYDFFAGTQLSTKVQFYAGTSKLKNALGSFTEYVGDTVVETWSGSLAQTMSDGVVNAMKSSSDEKIISSAVGTATNSTGNATTSISTATVEQALKDTLQQSETQTEVTSAISTSVDEIKNMLNSSGEYTRIINNTYALPTQSYANGGYPSQGMFLMNEGSSAEMLGTINGRTAVVNNEEISSALAQAMTPLLNNVVSAVQNIAANDRPIVLNVDSRQMARANQKGSQKLGYNQIGGEFANV